MLNESAVEAVRMLEPESETVEYKESFQEDCLKYLAALANTRGGTLRVGVRDDGTVLGWSGGGRDREAIVSKIADMLGVHPRETTIDPFAGTGGVLAITMAQAASPVAVRGRYYRRVGNSTREITDAERVRFLLDRTGQTWDALPSDAMLSELSSRTLGEFRTLAQERLPELSSEETNTGLLDKLALRLPDGPLKRGAFLLFGDRPQTRFHNADIQVGRFGDATTILDDQVIRGNLFDQFNQTIPALRKHLNVRYEFQNYTIEGGSLMEDLQRKEVWEIPLVALREAVLNALIHRDYTANTSIQIRIFDDRVMIDNPGGLLEDMTVENLLEHPHRSVRRNPVLAETIYYTKYIERWGSGTTRIRDACRAQGVPEPEFSATSHSFRVTFQRPAFRNPVAAPARSKADAVLEIAAREGRVTATACISQLGISRQYASKLLGNMVSSSLLIPRQAGRGRYYTLTNAGIDRLNAT